MVIVPPSPGTGESSWGGYYYPDFQLNLVLGFSSSAPQSQISKELLRGHCDVKGRTLGSSPLFHKEEHKFFIFLLCQNSI